LSLFFTTRASIKLFTKIISAKRFDSIINITLNRAKESLLPIDAVSGFIKANKINKVKVTAIWAIIVLPFLNCGVANNKTMPKNIGISAVFEGVSEPKYPQEPMIISTIEFAKFIKYGFIRL
jgi:hypothetical protein